MFGADDVRRFAGMLVRFAEQIVADPQAPIARLSGLSQQERQLLARCSDTPALTSELTLITLFETQAAETPGNLALSAGDAHLTYRELDERANRLAWQLIGLGVGPEDRVALLLERGSAAIIALLGVLKAGAAFVPLDPEHPRERLRLMLDDCAPDVVLRSPALPAALAIGRTSHVLTESGLIAGLPASVCTAPRNRDRVRPLLPGHPAYLIYTSGTTGIPKGVLVSHRGLPGLAEAQSRRLGIGGDSRVLQLASLSFDAAVSEIAMTLTRGSALIIAAAQARAGDDLRSLLIDEAITHATFTPTVLDTLAPADDMRLQSIIVAGEACPAELLARWAATCKVINAYGPTEGTVCATMSEPLGTQLESPPIGRPIETARVLVLDAALRPCPIGTVGEVYIAGEALARGYWRRPALTAQRFIASPFPQQTGERLYRTGDLAAWGADRQLVFHGRNDDQVKIRGARVELGEIVSTLHATGAVEQAIADVVEGSGNRRVLTAWVVPAAEAEIAVRLRREIEQEQIARWRDLEDNEPAGAAPEDPTFDTRGWNSLYTGEPLPPAAVREYADTTAKRILALQPRHLLEIGCGAGLITFGLLGGVTRYTGRDFSHVRTQRLRALQAREDLRSRFPALARAEFQQRAADDLQDLEPEYDVIALPSVVQYFPDVEYLLCVLDALFAHCLAPGGSLFIGDVRHLGLQEALHASVQSFRAAPGDRATDIAARVRKQLDHDQELALDPAFFLRLEQRYPRIRHVAILPKRGLIANEMTRFRFDVVIRTAGDALAEEALPWRPWTATDLTGLREEIAALRPPVLAWRQVPNARTRTECEEARRLLRESSLESISPAPAGIDPEALWQLGDDLGYDVQASFAASHADGAFDVIMHRHGTSAAPLLRLGTTKSTKPLRDCASNPLKHRFRQRLSAHLRAALESKLPAAMVPHSLVVLDELPRTVNGKLDRRALQHAEAQGAAEIHVAPETPTQALLCQLVAELLHLERVSSRDNFFHLGGDSISSIRLASRAREHGLLLTPRDVFLHPVLRDLAAVARTLDPAPVADIGDAEGTLIAPPIMRRFMEQAGWRHFHQTMLLDTPLDLDEENLQRILQALIDRHAMLRLRVRAGAAFVASMRDCPRDTLRCISLDPMDEIARAGALQRAHDEAVAALDPAAGRMLQAVWLQGPRGTRGRLLLVIHHFAVDGVSLRILAEDLAHAYHEARAGKAALTVTKSTSFRRWCEIQVANAPLRRCELPFWKAALSRPSLPLFAGVLDPLRDRADAARYVHRSLSIESTTTLLTTATSVFRAAINDVLLTALTLAVATWRQQRQGERGSALHVDVEGHGREAFDSSIDLTRTVGWFTTSFPVHLDAGDIELTAALAGGPDAGVALRRIRAQLREIPSGGIGFGMLRYLDPQADPGLAEAPAPQIAFNYLGRFGHGSGADFGASRDAPAVLGGMDADMPLDHPISLNAITHDTPAGPRLDVTWRFAPALVSEEDIAALADCWCSALTALAVHAATPGAGGLSACDLDLVRYEQSDVDAFKARLPDIEDIWPLTPMQTGLLYHSPGDAAAEDPYLIQLRLELTGAIDSARLRKALEALLARHANLRVRIQYDRHGVPVQLVPSSYSIPWHCVDLRPLSAAGQPARLDAFLNEDRATPFDFSSTPLIRACLLRLDDRRATLLLTMHHILLDGWSGALMLAELSALYLHDGDGAALLRPATFKSYLRWLLTQDREAAREAWRTALSGLENPTLLALPAAQAAPAAPAARTERTLPPALTSRLEALASGHVLTLAALVQGAWALLLARVTGRDDICFGAVRSGRDAPVEGIERIMGLLITTTPVRARIRPDERAMAFMRRLQREQADLMPHQHLPLAEIQRLCGFSPLFDCLFAFENYPALDRPHGDGLPLASVAGHSGTHYPLSLIVQPGRSLGLHLHYRPDAIPDLAAQAIVAGLAQMLEHIAQDPHAAVCSLAWVSAGERERLLGVIAGTAEPLPPLTVSDLFEAQVARTPDRIAVTGDSSALSYRELEARANRLAWRLIDAGIGPESLVALCLERGPVEMIVAILAVLKAGGAYLPLDASLPAERLEYMVRNAQPRLIVSTEKMHQALPPLLAAAPCILLDSPQALADLSSRPDRAPRDADRLAPLSLENPAYLIYTSGSTGSPKSIVNTHRNLTRLHYAAQDRFAFTEQDVWSLFHSYSFDFSVWEMWGALLRGGRLVIVPKAVARSPQAFGELLARERVTVLSQTPSAFRRLVQATADRSALHVHTVVLGGEVCQADLARAWADRCVVLNGYGPTEATVFATMSAALDGTAAPPIGTPIGNTRALVLDSSLQPCPAGIVGELYIGGAGLARGYLHRPGSTAARFIANPFAQQSGERLYRTGDFALRYADGRLEFRGRADSQVKLRGYRIETGEIEAALRAQDGIAHAIVRLHGAGDEAKLIAYVVARTPALDLERVRDLLARRLPDYMIPAAFVLLEELPLSPTGKLDERALPSPQSDALTAEYVAPVSPEERLLCTLIASLLGVARVGLGDHFFALGGHSLLAARLALQVRARLDRDLPVSAVFAHPVIGELARWLALAGGTADAFAPLLPIRPAGERPPLFCLHSGAGLCWSYANLLQITAADQPLYGVQARGLRAGDALPECLDEIVRGTIETIRSVQPTGPYHLAGWSFGGVVAHLVATRLQSAGEKVGRLILFDAYPPAGTAARPDGTQTWRELARGTGLQVPADDPLSPEAVHAAARAAGHVLGSFAIDQLHRLEAVMNNNVRLLWEASFGIFDGDVTLFTAARPTPGLDRLHADPVSWQRFCRGALRVTPIAAEHQHMLSPDSVRQMRGLL
ncbi:MAG TPA: amino acid adenylation domain-containing protein [Steroidobacteraceae bacterium]|nr:amino acid adenylation domain-containing protein [Steroidobacteraceae bacterium]